MDSAKSVRRPYLREREGKGKQGPASVQCEQNETTHVLPLNPLLHNILARRCEQSGPAPLIYRLLHHWFYRLDTDFCNRPVRMHRLLQLIRRNGSRVCGVDPRSAVLGALKPGLVVVHAAHKGAREQDLSELGARVQRVGPEVGVDFFESGEIGRGERCAVQVGGLEDEARVGGRLQVGEKGEGEEHLG